MKQKIGFVLLSTLVSLPALADIGNIYIAGKIGGSYENISEISNSNPYYPNTITPDETNQSVLAFGAAVGYRWNNLFLPIRMEVDYTYRNTLNYKSDDLVYNTDVGQYFEFNVKTTVESQTILGNLYIDFPLTDIFGLFIGGGGGLAYNSGWSQPYLILDGKYGAESTTDRTDVSWMATAGMTLTPADWVALDLSYRYTDLGAVRWSTYDEIELTSHNFTGQELFLTIRFMLPAESTGAVSKPLPYQPKVVTESHPQTKGATYVKPETKGATYEPERAEEVKTSP